MSDLIWFCRCALCGSSIDYQQSTSGCCGECGTSISDEDLLLIATLKVE